MNEQEENFSDIEKKLSIIRDTITPSTDQLQALLDTISVTPVEQPRYHWYQGRSFIINIYSAMSQKVMIGIVAVALIAIVGGYTGYQQFSKVSTSSGQVALNAPAQDDEAKEAVLPPAPEPTGNIDDVATAMTEELDQESTIVSESDTDIALATADNADLQTYSNIYDNTQQ